MKTSHLVSLLPLLGLLTLGACAQFNRSVNSGYASRTPKVVNSYSATETPRSDSDHTRIAYELGFNPANMSTEEMQQVQDRKQLRDLEKTLKAHQEKEQYSKVLPWLKDDAEKIEMLSIPSIEGRQTRPSVSTLFRAPALGAL